jgi:hypothetical protein
VRLLALLAAGFALFACTGARAARPAHPVADRVAAMIKRRELRVERETHARYHTHRVTCVRLSGSTFDCKVSGVDGRGGYACAEGEFSWTAARPQTLYFLNGSVHACPGRPPA